MPTKLKAMETVQPLPAMSDEISRSLLVSGDRGVSEMFLREDLTVDVFAKSGRTFRVFAQNVRWVEPAAAETAPEAELPSPPSAVESTAEPVPDTSFYEQSMEVLKKAIDTPKGKRTKA